MGKRRNNEFACIVDPLADHGKAQHRWPFFKERLYRLISDSPVYFCSPEKTVEDLVDTVIREGYSSILLAGDDRTTNRVVNKLMKYDVGERPRIGLLCASSTGQSIFNSLYPKARFLGDQDRLATCVEFVMNAETQLIDLGKVSFVGSRHKSRAQEAEPRYFVNLATFGISNFIYDRLEENMAALHSGLAFVAAAAQSLLSYDPPQLSLRAGTRLLAKDEEVFNLFIANGRYGPGGMILNEEGSLWDGKMHALLIPELTINEVFTELPKLWMRGKDPDPSMSKTAKSFRLQCGSLGALSRIDLDGVPAPAPPAVIHIEPSAVSFFCKR